MERISIGEVATVRSGFAFKSRDWLDAGVSVIKIGNIKAGWVTLDGCSFVSEEVAKEAAAFELCPGDVLISMTGHIGEVARVRSERRMLLNQRVGRFIVRDAARLNMEFLYYCLQEPELKASMAAHAYGVAQPNISPSLIEQQTIQLPPLSVQRRIAGTLSAYDKLIENNQRRIQILETMARALYREWFVEFRFPGHENVPRVASSIGDIPEGWEVNSLESLMADYIGGGWGKETGDDKHTEPAWVIRGTDIPGARNCQVAGVPYRFHAGSNIRSRRLLTGDILFEVSGGSKGQPVGRTLLVTPQLLSAFGDVPIICASFCKRIRPDAAGYGSELLYLSFVEGYTSGEIEQFQVQSTGISNFKWTEYIGKTQRAIPPEPLRVRFRELVAPLFSQIGTRGLTIQNLRRTRDLLLPRLLSGQVTLADAAA